MSDVVKNLDQMKKFWAVVETADQGEPIIKESNEMEIQQVKSVIYALEEFRESVKEQLRDLDRSLAKLRSIGGCSTIAAAAHAYWYGHIKSALGDPDYHTHATTVERTVEQLKDELHSMSGEPDEDGYLPDGSHINDLKHTMGR